MSEFANSFAKSILASQKDKIAAMPKEQRKQYAIDVLSKASQAPVFNQSGMPVNETTAANILKADEGFSKHKEMLRRSNKWTDEQMLQRGAITENQFDRGDRRDAELQGMGVITDRDLPTGDWKLGFGADRVQDLSNVLTKHYGVPVAVGKTGDDIVYLDPKEKKLVKANFGMAASAGHAIPMVADVAGTVLVGGTSPQGAVAKTVAKETFGSGVFTTAGEATRLAIGKALGVHNLEWDEIGVRSAKVGGEAAAFTGGIGTVVAGAKGVHNFVKGGIFNRDEAAKYGLSEKEADDVIAEVNNILKQGGKDSQVKATLAQKMDDVNLASAESQLKASQEHGQRFAERAKSDQAASKEALDVISAPPVTVEKGIGDVGDIARSRVGKRVEQAKQVVSRNVNDLNKQLNDIGKVWKTEVGEPTVKILADKRDLSELAMKSEWNKVKQLGKYDETSKSFGIEIPHGANTAKLRSILKRRAGSAQTQVSARGSGGAYVEPPKPKEGIEALQGKQDLADLNREISDIRSEVGKAHVGKSKSPSSEKDLIDMRDALVEDRRVALIKSGRTDVLEAIEKAEADTLRHNETYVRSVVGDLLEKTPNGTPVIRSADFVDDVIKRNPEEIQDFKKVIYDDMELTQQWKEGIADSWKKAAFNEKGRYSADASKEWIKKHTPALKEFFTGAEMKSLMNTGKLAEKVYGTKVTAGGIQRGNMISRLQQFKNKANSKWGSGAIGRADKEGLTKFITGKGGSWATPSGRGIQERVSKIQFVKNMTANHPAAWTAIQNDFKQKIRNDLIAPSTVTFTTKVGDDLVETTVKKGSINPQKLANWVADDENARVVKEMLGSQYLKDLRSIDGVIKIINKSEHRVTASQEAKGLVQAFRAGAAPPLTRRGRAFTATITFYNANSQKRIADAILDEKSIRKVADLAEHSAHTRRFYEKAFSLGFALPDEDEE